jgi:4-hydroxy-tetrahydrodipicolinate reductase
MGYGKMGRAVRQLAVERGWVVTGVVERDQGGLTALGGADVAIEFTTPGAAVGNIRAALDAGCPIVVGTTGWYGVLPAVEADVSRSGGALLWAPNFSIGAAIFRRLVEDAARRFADVAEMDPHLVETHHAAKRDAPSGTALALAQLGEAALGRAIPITSVRVGSVPGTHELLFDAPFEQIRLEHVVRDRRVFAAGALRAAEWLIGKRGVFTLDDVLATDGADR